MILCFASSGVMKAFQLKVLLHFGPFVWRKQRHDHDSKVPERFTLKHNGKPGTVYDKERKHAICCVSDLSSSSGPARAGPEDDDGPETQQTSNLDDDGPEVLRFT